METIKVKKGYFSLWFTFGEVKSKKTNDSMYALDVEDWGLFYFELFDDDKGDIDHIIYCSKCGKPFAKVLEGYFPYNPNGYSYWIRSLRKRHEDEDGCEGF